METDKEKIKLIKQYKEKFGKDFLIYDKYNFVENIKMCLENGMPQKEEPIPTLNEINKLQDEYKRIAGKYFIFDNCFIEDGYYYKYTLLNEIKKLKKD